MNNTVQVDNQHDNEPTVGAASTHQFSAPPRKRLLRRSRQDRVIGGICGGLGRYVDVDPVLFRIMFIALLIPGGLGLLLYLISTIVIPDFRSVQDEIHDNVARPLDSKMVTTILGTLLIGVGTLILLERVVDWFDAGMVVAGALILSGALIVWRGTRNEAA